MKSEWARKNDTILSEQISKGGCELWAAAVVRTLRPSREAQGLPGPSICQEHGHYSVQWYGMRFDSDTDYDTLDEIEKEVERIDKEAEPGPT